MVPVEFIVVWSATIFKMIPQCSPFTLYFYFIKNIKMAGLITVALLLEIVGTKEEFYYFTQHAPVMDLFNHLTTDISKIKDDRCIYLQAC